MHFYRGTRHLAFRFSAAIGGPVKGASGLGPVMDEGEREQLRVELTEVLGRHGIPPEDAIKVLNASIWWRDRALEPPREGTEEVEEVVFPSSYYRCLRCTEVLWGRNQFRSHYRRAHPEIRPARFDCRRVEMKVAPPAP